VEVLERYAGMVVPSFIGTVPIMGFFDPVKYIIQGKIGHSEY
jgi:hypothetical protein